MCEYCEKEKKKHPDEPGFRIVCPKIAAEWETRNIKRTLEGKLITRFGPENGR